MRLDFNILLIDDDINDDDENEDLLELKAVIKQHILGKGFNPNICIAEDITQANKIPKNRFDLFISDNNLKGNEKGINYYLEISRDYICDFILYTRSEIKNITDEIIAHLNNPKNNPNIFSRFSFTERKKDGVWINDIKKLINHVLSRREQINNFRGLYAQLTARMDQKIKSKFNIRSENFSETISRSCAEGRINEELGQQLHKIRMLRNSLMHNDEVLCEKTNKYKICCSLLKDKVTNKLMTSENYDINRRRIERIDILEDNLKEFRDEITDVYKQIETICS